ncbi:MAG: peptidylprolyl isomerase [Geothermobacteraceae bacterium]
MKSFGIFVSLLISVLAPALALAGEKVVLKDNMDKINYSVGHQIGDDFRNQGVEVRPDALLAGILDSVNSQTPAMKKGEMRQVLLDLKKMVLEGERKKKESYRGEGRAFLEANAQKEGVVVLESGLQYMELRSGDGPKPTLADTIKVHYRGTRLDGREFDSSYRRGQPESMPLGKTIPGWQKALVRMPVGAKWKLFLSPDLAFGEKGPLADQTVIYEIELLGILPQESKSN